MKPELYGMGRMSTAHLYAVPCWPVSMRLETARRACRRSSDDNCRLGGRPASPWPYSGRSPGDTQRVWMSCWPQQVAAPPPSTCSRADRSLTSRPEAPDFQEAAELTGDTLTQAQRILDERGLAGDFPSCAPQALTPPPGCATRGLPPFGENYGSLRRFSRDGIGPNTQFPRNHGVLARSLHLNPRSSMLLSYLK